MVLELLINPASNPARVFAAALIYTLVAAAIAQKLFPSSSSILAISFATMLFIPFFQRLFAIEEKKDEHPPKSTNIFFRHKETIFAFSAFFLGVMMAFSFMYVFFPSQQLFAMQAETLRSFGAGKITDAGDFSKFFWNNTQVMVAMFLLSFAFGAGAVFILTWNASVIALYLGLFVKSLVPGGAASTAAFLYGVPVGLGTIALHGIPEISAYFIAGLAGGLLSVGVIREKLGSDAFRLVAKDALLLLLLAEFFISAGAYLEAAL